MPLLIVLPWAAVFIVYQTGALNRAVQYFDRGWAARDPDGLSLLTRISLEHFRVGECDSGLLFLEWIEIGAPFCPSWVRGAAIECLEATDRHEEASRLLDAHCSSTSPAGDAVPAFRVNPDYPQTAMLDEVEGWVVVEFDVAEDGRVSGVKVHDSEPRARFDQSATNAVARWRYCPGAPASDLKVRLVFELAK